MGIELTVVISIACTIVGASIGIATFNRNTRKEAAEGGKSGGVILTEIGYIKGGIDDIKKKQDEHSRQNFEMAQRITKVEGVTDSLCLRVGRLEGIKHGKDS